MINPQAAGYIGAALATVFFGSNYIPVKNYPTGNGFAFAWVMSIGTFCTGFIAMAISGKFIFIPWGLLGGSLWAIGNFCVIPIVKTIGLGLGMLLWGCTSLITGFFSGKFGWFGLEKQAVEHTGLNWGGFACIVVAIALFFFIKPTLKDKGPKSEYDYSPIVEDMSINYHRNNRQAEPVEEPMFFERMPAPYKYLVGLTLAVVSGVLYGVNMVPMQLWKQNNPDANSLEFVFCHFSGIFLFNTLVFILYSMFDRPPQIYPQTILPSYLSGVLWGIAQVGLMVATQNLGYTVGFPIGSSGPLIVSSLWSVLLFKEIQGKKNLIFLGASFLFLITGIVLITLSNIKSL
ncbi:hypothetical protein SAMD00019534_050310 [Acytostelium subglobosum LB1]|uniref:hypothetical protein n=1 Tax=Acytostelium subglobosum LB1 TaxID=1410327 RepID=UPI000644F2E9|nr:hypothetical protein SAMD00019534_050310 [Acytostelium subglobosum LB1]GAM21856.1 hypothetical protein SAMD00019534_050310 [Acytostelium subglobosum LB1]|eukprot:XP_012754956.1 hypothetical protein SAMD00019534_050310 [Acytostelium subglobosum LB1]